MPYAIRKYRGKDLYYVYNPETKERFSAEPMMRKLAMKQLRALYANEGIDYDKQIKKPKVMHKRRFEPGSDRAKEIMAKAREVRLANVAKRKAEKAKALEVVES
jgi:hypothetical protein